MSISSYTLVISTYALIYFSAFLWIHPVLCNSALYHILKSAISSFVKNSSWLF